MDNLDEAEKHLEALGRDNPTLTFLPSHGLMCPWLMTANCTRVVAFYTFAGRWHTAGYVCWSHGMPAKQIEKDKILDYLLN